MNDIELLTRTLLLNQVPRHLRYNALTAFPSFWGPRYPGTSQAKRPTLREVTFVPESSHRIVTATYNPRIISRVALNLDLKNKESITDGPFPVLPALTTWNIFIS